MPTALSPSKLFSALLTLVAAPFSATARARLRHPRVYRALGRSAPPSFHDYHTRIAATFARGPLERVLVVGCNTGHECKAFVELNAARIDGLDVVAQVQMAQEAGGDFFDFQELPDGRLYMVEADVSGKGLPAALLMSAARSVIRATASQGIGPHQVLTRVNEQLYADLTEVSKFVTVFMGLYSPETRQLRYSNAGHSAAIYRPHDGVARIVEPDNPPVGVLDSYEYLEQSMEFETGDLLVVCSDGYLEATNAKGEMFGLRRMIEQVTALGDRPAQEIADALLAKVTEFAQGIRQFDDQSLVILRGV